MKMPDLKKNKLTPRKYDEVSLVDGGANQDSDVLIFKRTPVEGTKYKRGNKKFVALKPKSLQELADEENKGGGKGLPHEKKKKGKTGSTKNTKRAKNWKESRHPRDIEGEWDQTSSESKKKYGRNGTTKAKLQKKPKKGVVASSGSRPFTKKTMKPGGKSTRLVMEPGGRIHREKVKKSDLMNELMSDWMEGKVANHGS